MTDEYDSWRRYEDAKAFKNKLAEIDRLKNRIEKLEAALEPFADLVYEIDGEMYERLAHNLEDGAFIKARKALEGKDGA